MEWNDASPNIAQEDVAWVKSIALVIHFIN